MFSALTEEASKRIDAIIEELLVQVEADSVFLCDRAGNIVAQKTVNEFQNAENIGALASGSFFATVEMARLVGEPKFKSLLHQGDKNSIYMEGISSGDLIILVVFSNDSNPGLVKLYTRNACHQLEQFHTSISGEPGVGSRIPAMKIELDENAAPFVRSAPGGADS
jgi:predicted regulator of Ras-like GTPase activity (Roadblock/LC7/MglB family)